jgi:1,4-dihydroxy-2-naphthoyl-CoA hydrolase
MNAIDTDRLHALIPYTATLGIRVAHATPESVRLEVGWREELSSAEGVMHGGALMSLADTAGALCAFFNLPEGANTATVESKTNLLAAVRDGTVVATSTPLHAGRTVIVAETELRNGERLVAKTTQTQAVLHG